MSRMVITEWLTGCPSTPAKPDKQSQKTTAATGAVWSDCNSLFISNLNSKTSSKLCKTIYTLSHQSLTSMVNNEYFCFQSNTCTYKKELSLSTPLATLKNPNYEGYFSAVCIF